MKLIELEGNTYTDADAEGIFITFDPLMEENTKEVILAFLETDLPWPWSPLIKVEGAVAPLLPPYVTLQEWKIKRNFVRGLLGADIWHVFVAK